MAKPSPAQTLSARLMSALVVSGIIWLLLLACMPLIPKVLEFLEKKHLEPYNAAFASGDPKRVRALFDRDLKGRTEDPAAYLAIADICLKTHHPDVAIEYLNRSLLPCKDAPRPTRADLYGMLAECYARVEPKPQQQAILAAQRAAELDPSSPRWLNAYGYVLADNDIQLDEAVQRTSLALQLLKKTPSDDPTMDCKVEDSYGWALYKKGNYDAAVAALNQAIADVPREIMDSPLKGELLAPLYYHLGAASRRQGKIDIARQALQTALTYAPGNKDAKAELDDLNSHTPAHPTDKGAPQQPTKPDITVPAKSKPDNAGVANWAGAQPGAARVASASEAKEATDPKPTQKDAKAGSPGAGGQGAAR